ncbi:MAG: SO_0444 family Cu/Zn efflux transporter [gamma proteobacterium symbiont of Bathyaustriella thionipta]|nr:SO_0444 family Cu/Zn efflux transporter [gamma proteobacterium symbiont of Bathyaustriella thionipta]
MEFFNNLLLLALSAAPWLLFGLILGGLIKAWVPQTFLQRHLGGHGFVPVTKAALLGAPFPLCSCGVVPAALGLRKAGASREATVSFLISTPETGVDSVLVTYALMGPVMAIVRPVTAVFSALTAGLLVSILPQQKHLTGSASNKAQCSSKSHCCNSDEGTSNSCRIQSPLEDKWFTKGWQGIRYALGDLLDDLVLWLTLGLFLAAAIQTWVPTSFLTQWGSGLPAMLLMILIGIPMYVCATASTPIAAGMMMAGISPGTALVFLMTGPATNIATLGIVKREMGIYTLYAYLAGVAIIALLAGLMLDHLSGYGSIYIQQQMNPGLEVVPAWLAWGSLLLIIAVAIWNKIRSH